MGARPPVTLRMTAREPLTETTWPIARCSMEAIGFSFASRKSDFCRETFMLPKPL
jgi:hypothetical protein